MADGKAKVIVECDSPTGTKNTSHFTEVGGKEVLNGHLYVTNAAMSKLGNPEKVKVTIEAL